MAGDVSFDSVSALLHFDGTNGSTTVPDRAPTPKTWTCTGTVALGTGQAKFGSAACRFQASGALYTPTHSDFVFGSGDWTIEYQLYATANPGSAQGLVLKRSITSGFAPFYNYLNTNGKIHVSVSTSGSAWAADADVSTAITLNAWNHVAFVRSGTNIYLFLNGTNVGTYAIGSGALMTSSADFVIGAGGSDGGVPFDGYIDEVRVTKGLARYVANFTPPAAAFENGGSYDVTGIAPTTAVGTPAVPYQAGAYTPSTAVGTPNSPYTQTLAPDGFSSTGVGTPGYTQRCVAASIGRVTTFGVPGRPLHQFATGVGFVAAKVGTKPTAVRFTKPTTTRAARARGVHTTKFGRPTT